MIATSNMDGTATAKQDAGQPARIGIRLRMLGAMCLVMFLFLTGLLIEVYQRMLTVPGIHSTAEAKSIVISLIPVIVLVLALCALLFFYLMNRLFMQPIKQIRDAASAVGKGERITAIDNSQNDEIGDLAKSVNGMAQTLQQDIRNLQEADKLKAEFIAISSHYLRTPLTGITGGLEMLGAGQLDESAKQAFAIIRESVNKLLLFSEDMLTIADFEAGESNVRLEPVLLHDILAPLVAVTKPTTERKGLAFTTMLDVGDARVLANSSLLRLAFRNILDNACKFTEHGEVSLLAQNQGEDVVVTIKDTGIGIPKNEMPNLFTKFHRATSTLAYNFEGAGIGLYIAKFIFDRHHANVAISSIVNEGTEVTVRLRRAS